jgi:three-Cys-motif partner protein
MVDDITRYAGREQAAVKHYFLRSYLESLVFKTASSYEEISYVDGFSGPWQHTGENYEDTSFGIALASLRKAKAAWKELNGRDVRMSAHLVEKAKGPYAELETIKARFPDIDVHTYRGDFVARAPEIAKAIPRDAFAFLFIDPKGWRIPMGELAPLLRRDRTEVVFNFMFEFINRAASISDPAIESGLRELMPYGSWREQLVDAPPEARRSILANAFAETLARIGNYRYVAEIPILRPLKDRTLYSLFYGTRHPKGIEVFREYHVKTERAQASIRQATKSAHREAASGQGQLFGADVAMGPSEVEAFFDRERAEARLTLLALAPTEAGRRTTYGDLWPLVLTRHAVTKVELNQIAAALRREGCLNFPDWGERKRVPADAYRLWRSA